jgi:glycosidase
MISQADWMHEAALTTIDRVSPRIQSRFRDAEQWQVFHARLLEHFPRAFAALYPLYGHLYDFFYHLEVTLTALADAFIQRPDDLHALDARRQQEPDWFQSHEMMGAVCYVDLFAGDLAGMREQIPYLQQLGITYLHLMPLFKTPATNNDGGYAVSSFREVNPKLGTMADLARLAGDLRAQGISLVLDFVFNHTSDEHDWALRAKAGDKVYQGYYRIFPDRTLPDLYQPHLREIFPEQAPGAFTYDPALQQWVWTTFYPFQWDLNYANPAVFTAMLSEMLFLANQGVEVLRLDAVPFIWKEMGTPCENLPQVNTLIEAYNALVRIAAPALLFKSEAIVHPRDVRKYIGPARCQLSYNPIMMVSLWEALATRQVTFMTHTLQKQFPLEPGTAWINYVRSHDDIGWGFADEDAAEVGIKGDDHRYFLNQFYTGQFPGSFAMGEAFNYNPRTGDMRISGTAASLAGLEQALLRGDPVLIDHALRRLILLYGLVIAAGGIPLLYLDDEVATLNDRSYIHDPHKALDNRWMHRPKRDPVRYAEAQQPDTIPGRVFSAIRHLIRIRKSTAGFGKTATTFVHTGNEHVLGMLRGDQLLVLANFSEFAQTVSAKGLPFLFSGAVDLITGETLPTDPVTIDLAPYQMLWIKTT